jgi:hypothetical protein
VLAGYFSGTRLTGRVFGVDWYVGWVPQPGNPASSERYDLPFLNPVDIGTFSGTSGPDGWRHPLYFRDKKDYWNLDVVNNPNANWQEVVNKRLEYGFKRPFYANTHHYFGLLRAAHSVLFTWPLSLRHEGRRVDSIYSTYQQLLQDNNPEAQAWYEIQFYDTAADLYLDSLARWHSQGVYNFGIDVLPGALEFTWCAKTEEEIWSLDGLVASYGRNFRDEVQP